MKPTRRKWWRPYLLVEVLVALSLVSLCLVPLLRPHITGLRAQVAIAQRVELERLAELALAEVKQHLYEHKEYEWRRKDAKPQLMQLGSVQARFMPDREVIYYQRAIISIAEDALGQKTEDTDHVERRLLHVVIQFAPEVNGQAKQQFDYTVLVERMKFEVESVEVRS
jgi:hypothetical protein